MTSNRAERLKTEIIIALFGTLIIHLAGQRGVKVDGLLASLVILHSRNGSWCTTEDREKDCNAEGDAHNSNAALQPPETDVACNDDVRVSIVGQMAGAAAVDCTVWFGDLFQII